MSGFYRVATAIPRIKIADIKYNVEEIISLIQGAEEEGAEVVLPDFMGFLKFFP